MAQFKLKSTDILLCLVALLKRMAEALQYVLAHPGEITINTPDHGGLYEFKVGTGCPPDKGLPSPEETDRGNAEILLGILKLIGNGRGQKSTAKAKP